MKRTNLLKCGLIFLLLFLSLVSCTSANNQILSTSIKSTEPEITPTYTVEMVESEIPPSVTPFPATFTPTDPNTPTIPVSTVTLGTDILATLEAVQKALDTALAQISTLEAENRATVIPQPTSTAYYSPTAWISQSSPTPTTPSNVTTAVIISSKANLRYTKKNNDAGNPIMLIYEPRIKLDQGSYTWIYKEAIMSDGGIIYFEIHDPDGVVTTVFYIRKVDVQVRSEAHKTSYGPVPLDVAKAEFVIKANLREIRAYNDSGIPIMGIPDDRVIFEAGDSIWIYPRPIESDGGTIYFQIYDPDGNVSRILYVRDKDIIIPSTLQ